MLNLDVMPNFRMVNNNDFSLDYNELVDTVSVNINPSHKFDKQYLFVQGIMESSSSPRRGYSGRIDNGSYNREKNSQNQSKEYYASRITYSIATLVMLYYLQKGSAGRKQIAYNAIRAAAKQCLATHNKTVEVDYFRAYRICSYFIFDDPDKLNKKRLIKIFRNVQGLVERDFANHIKKVRKEVT